MIATPSSLALQDQSIQAWSWLADPATCISTDPDGPLAGLTFGVKDVLDVQGMPTRYGAHFPHALPAERDAACVALLRQAGAIAMGKTVTAEFAYAAPGPTRNPLNLDHTPGGSSSGSAAAVAAGMVNFALGTQTGGSMMRPAAFTGILGFKPSFGAVHRSGLFLLCDSLDTIGYFSRDLSVLRRVASVLQGLPDSRVPSTPRIGVLDGKDLGPITPAALAALEQGYQHLEQQGARLERLPADAQLKELLILQGQIMAYEMARSLLPVWQASSDALRPVTVQAIKQGLELPPADYHAWQARRRQLQQEWQDRYGHFDALLTPAAPGPAPYGLDSTGSSVLNRPWSLLGWPTLSLPAPGQNSPLPLGLQLIGQAHQDGSLLDLASLLCPVKQV
ncbi:amidase [Alcaligenes aquatilis]|uniref:Amidase n=1 Tax=Alcaligenes aquatilis TaxID=323284 RepID=A0A3G2HRE0_9BURK|nr:amidase [Alcaligenes aquatilis]AYN19481.1 amidase [Alcaligenes aquatilis]